MATSDTNLFLSDKKLESNNNEIDEDNDSSSIDNEEILRWLAWLMKNWLLWTVFF